MSVVGVVLFLCVVAFLRSFHPEGVGIDRKGLFLIVYHLCRVAMVGCIIAFCFGAGYFALELLRIPPRTIFANPRKTFIVCFFFGATIYGSVFSALGLAGLINLVTGLICTVPVILLSIRPLTELIADLNLRLAREAAADTYAGPIAMRVILLCAIVATVVFLMAQVLFIAIFDPNIWEHYLHYYRAVLNTGSTQPNEVWHHFYASKAAGLIILADVLSDFFGAQIVSACFALVAALIVFDVLVTFCKSTSWALFGATLFILFMYGDVSAGAMFKHHLVMLGYASFAFWSVAALQDAQPEQRKILLIVLGLSMLYLGFYLPVAAVIFPFVFVLVGLSNLMLRIKPNFFALFTLALAAVAGGILVFAVNFRLTGLLEVTPMRLLWAIADKAKVESIFGLGGIEYFLRINNDVSPNYDWAFWHTLRILRYPLPNEMLAPTVVAGILVVIHDLVRKKRDFTVLRLTYLLAFTLPLNAFAQIIQSNAVVERLALFSIVFTTIASILIWKRLADLILNPVFFRSALCRATRELASGISFSSDNDAKWLPVFRVLKRLIMIGIVFFGVTTAYRVASINVSALQLKVIRGFASGQMSMKEAFQSMEYLNRATPMLGIGDMIAYRKIMMPGERILRLTYDSGYALSLPATGIVSEPTYAVVDNPFTLLQASPQDVASYLKERNLSHFTLNLRSRMFSTVGFTSLFDPLEVRKYLRLSYENNDYAILTWLRSAEVSNIPDYFLRTLDFKRTGILHRPFTQEFISEVVTGNNVVDNVASYERLRSSFGTDVSNRLDRDLAQLSLDSSREELRKIWRLARDQVEKVDVLSFLQTRAEPGGTLRILRKLSEAEVKARLLPVFLAELRKQYIASFGDELAGLSERCDERVTFGIVYPVSAVCP